MDKISVIVPVYKTEKYLDKCIGSIVDQTYENLEIILVDDASPDHCPIKCDEWAAKDHRIKVLHIPNKGVANARNTALKIASGDYVAFVDSDDYAEPDMLEILYNHLQESNADICVCGFFGNEYEESELCDTVSAEEALKKIAVGDFLFGVLWNKLYKKVIIQDVEMPQLVCCEDLVFNYFAFNNCKSVKIIKDKKYHYVYHNNSVTRAHFNIGSFDAVKSKQIILNHAQGTALESYAIKGLITSCFVVLSGAIKANGFEKERKMLRQTILHYKNWIYRSPMYSKRDKIKTLVLSFSEKLYKSFIEKNA